MDTLNRKERSKLMSRIHGKRTGPEMRLHGWLKGNHVAHKMWPKIPGNPDIVVGDGLAVFVNGCFWHGCAKHYREPKSNVAFWRGKILANAKRQRKSVVGLRRLGFEPIVLWEHSVKDDSFKRILEGIGHGRKAR